MRTARRTRKGAALSADLTQLSQPVTARRIALDVVHRVDFITNNLRHCALWVGDRVRDTPPELLMTQVNVSSEALISATADIVDTSSAKFRFTPSQLVASNRVDLYGALGDAVLAAKSLATALEVGRTVGWRTPRAGYIAVGTVLKDVRDTARSTTTIVEKLLARPAGLPRNTIALLNTVSTLAKAVAQEFVAIDPAMIEVSDLLQELSHVPAERGASDVLQWSEGWVDGLHEAIERTPEAQSRGEKRQDVGTMIGSFGQIFATQLDALSELREVTGYVEVGSVRRLLGELIIGCSNAVDSVQPALRASRANLGISYQ